MRNKKPDYAIYPTYSFKKWVDNGQLTFYPMWSFYENGKKYIMKLTGYPYPKIIDVMTKQLEASHGAGAKSLAIASMEMVFGAMQLMKENGEQSFKIVVYDDAEEDKGSADED